MSHIKDVAERAGVSITTVSRVINKSRKVSPGNFTKVEKAISELNYSTNSIARSLKVSKTNRIAVIITAISRTFFTSVLEGVSHVAEKNGYTVVIAETNDNLDREIQLVNAFASQWVDGIILASSAYSNEASAKEYIAQLGKLRKKDINIPVVSLEFTLDNPQIDAVIIDYEQAAFDAVTYLINEIGRSRILHISHPKGHIIGNMRSEGYCRALSTAKLPRLDSYVIPGNYTTYSGYLAMRQFLDSGNPVDAVYCANDQMAVGVIKACEETGIRIPEDIAIIGTDDVFAASIVSPTLSSISIPKFEMGSVAMTLLHKRIMSSEPSERSVTMLGYDIIERESTKKGIKNFLKYLQW